MSAGPLLGVSAVVHGWVLPLALTVLLLAVTAIVVAAETSVVAVRRGGLEELAAAGDRQARRVLKLLDDLPATVTAAQIVLSTAALGLGALAGLALGPALTPFLARLPLADLPPATVSLALALLVVVLLHIVLGMLAPTHLSLVRAEAVALSLSGPMRVAVVFLRPLAVVFGRTADLLVRALRSAPVTDHQVAHTPAQLAQALVDSQHLGTITPSDAQVMRAALELADLTAGAAMTPRIDVEALPDTATGEDALTLAHATGFTRFPVYHRDVDDVIGLVHVKDLLTATDPAVLRQPISEVLRPIVAVSITRDLEHLLADMLDQRAHAVLVVDEFGGTAGLLSLEDVLEELVGEIADEYDDEEYPVTSGRRTWRVPGTTRRDELARLTGIELVAYEADTVSGWLVERLDRLVEPGDVVTSEGWTLRVLTVSGRRAGDVEVRAPER